MRARPLAPGSGRGSCISRTHADLRGHLRLPAPVARERVAGDVRLGDAALFGDVREKERPLLTLVVAAAAVWPFLLIGIVFPRQAALVLAILPVPEGDARIHRPRRLDRPDASDTPRRRLGAFAPKPVSIAPKRVEKAPRISDDPRPRARLPLRVRRGAGAQGVRPGLRPKGGARPAGDRARELHETVAKLRDALTRGGIPVVPRRRPGARARSADSSTSSRAPCSARTSPRSSSTCARTTSR